MNKDILNIILNDVLHNDINSIKKISLINRDWRQSVANLSNTDIIKNKLDIIYRDIDEPNQCMYQAAEKGYIDIIDLTIKKGANEWDAALCRAVGGNQIDIVIFMIKKGAKYLENGIFMAACYGNIDMLNFLAEKGGYCCSSSLEAAVVKDHIDAVQWFMENSPHLHYMVSKLIEITENEDMVELLKHYR